MRVNETCEFLAGEGIFSALDSLGVPWADRHFGSLLDADYYLIYGNKETSPLVDYLAKDGKLDHEATEKIANIIFNRYGENWKRLELAFSKEYNPIWNKDGTVTVTTENSEKETSFVKGEQSNASTIGSQTVTNEKGEQTNTNEYGDTVLTESNGAITTTNSYGKTAETTENGAISTTNSYGKTSESVTNGAKKTTAETTTSAFNSSSYQPDNKTVTDEAGVTNKTSNDAHEDTVKTGAVTNKTSNDAHEDTVKTGEVTNKTTEGTHTDILTDGTRTDTLTNGARSDTMKEGQRTDTTTEGATTQTVTTVEGGNIGVTTTQQMLTEEFNMREKFNFFEIIFRNVDSVLSCGFYC